MKISNTSYSGMKPMEIRFLYTHCSIIGTRFHGTKLDIIHTCIYYLCIRVREKKKHQIILQINVHILLVYKFIFRETYKQLESETFII